MVLRDAETSSDHLIVTQAPMPGPVGSQSARV